MKRTNQPIIAYSHMEVKEKIVFIRLI